MTCARSCKRSLTSLSSFNPQFRRWALKDPETQQPQPCHCLSNPMHTVHMCSSITHKGARPLFLQPSIQEMDFKDLGRCVGPHCRSGKSLGRSPCLMNTMDTYIQGVIHVSMNTMDTLSSEQDNSCCQPTALSSRSRK